MTDDTKANETTWNDPGGKRPSVDTDPLAGEPAQAEEETPNDPTVPGHEQVERALGETPSGAQP